MTPGQVFERMDVPMKFVKWAYGINCSLSTCFHDLWNVDLFPRTPLLL